MRVEQIAMGLVCLLGGTGTVVAQEPVRPRGAAVTIASCPATAAPMLMTVDLGERSDPDMPAAAVLDHGGGQLNTFAAPRTDTIDLSACRIAAAGKVVARDVAIRIPREACETTPAILATDLLVIDASVPLPTVTERYLIVRNEKAIGSVLAVAGRRLLANAFGAASEKAYRSSAAEALIARVRQGELSVVGREDDTAVAAAAVASGSDVAGTPAGGEQAADGLSDSEPFVFITSAVCTKDL